MKTNRRLSREDWVRVAREALVSAGVDDVKVDRLARKLKVTRGSFYHHFQQRQELLDALLDDWNANNKRQLDQLAERLRESSDLADLWRLWLGEDPAFPSFDMAIRIWARKAPKIAKVVHRVDDAWIDLLQGFFLSSGMSDLESLVRARVVYFHQIGYYALAIEEGLDERIRLAPFYYRVLLGGEPSASLAKALSNIKKPARRATSASSE